jgi:hypothetical protein
MPELTKIPDKEYEIKLEEFFEDIESNLNDLPEVEPVPLMSSGSLVSNLGPIDFEFDVFGDTEKSEKFSTITLAEGILTVNLSLIGLNLSGIGIKLDDIKLEVPGRDTPIPASPVTVNLYGSDTATSVTFDLKNVELSATKLLKFHIGNISDLSGNAGTPFSLKIKPQLSQTKVKGVTGLKTTDPLVLEIEDQEIDLEHMNEFVYAKIKEGTLKIPALLPSNLGDDTLSSFTGFEQVITLFVQQDDKSPYNGLSGAIPWEITSGPDGKINEDLKDKDIVNNPILMGGNGSAITIKSSAGGASFTLSDEDVDNEYITITLSVDMDIVKFAEVHIDISDILEPINI